MPFATCRRCNAVFIVGNAAEALSPELCPNCGGTLEEITQEDARQHIRKQWDEAPERPATRQEPPEAPSLRGILSWVAGVPECPAPQQGMGWS